MAIKFPQTLYYGRDLTRPLSLTFVSGGLPADLSGLVWRSYVSDQVTEVPFARFTPIQIAGNVVTLDRIQWLARPPAGARLVWDVTTDNRVIVRTTVVLDTKATPL